MATIGLPHIIAEIREALAAGDRARASGLMGQIIAWERDAREAKAKADELHLLAWNSRLMAEELFRGHDGTAEANHGRD